MTTSPGRYRDQQYIPLRADPEQSDPQDELRVEMVMRRWRAQDQAYLGYAKQVELHIRMLSGRQWDTWSPVYGRYIDVRQFMTDAEKKHRMRPVMDYLGYWFALTLSKMIENQPAISFLPATADRKDAMLAAVMEPVWKTLFEQIEADSRIVRAVAWSLVAGESHFMTSVDFQAGPKRELIHPAVLELMGADGVPIQRVANAVPYDAKGNPRAKLTPPDPADPEGDGEYGYDVTGEPYQDLEGEPKLSVPCPLQIRAQWGSNIEWKDKRWIGHEWFLTPDQVKEQFAVACDPDHYVAGDEGEQYLERMLFGAGYFGSNAANPSEAMSGSGDHMAHDARNAEGYVRGITIWEKPVKGFTDPTDENPAGGRLLVVAPGNKKVLWDSMRPFNLECAGPIRRVPFLEIPGRAFGSTMLEKLVPLQKRLNKIEAHIAQHANLVSDPILLVHDAANIDDDEWVATPGTRITHGYNGSGDAAKWLIPPPLSNDVWREKAEVRDQLFVIGAMAGNQSESPTANASGELVEQLRVNADRPLTPLSRNLVIGIADVAKDIQAVLPTIWDREKVIAYAGDDNVTRTVTLLPEMFDGKVHVKPSIESAAAGTKDKRQNRLIQLYEMGAFGNLLDPTQQPKATQQLMTMLQFPDLNRAMMPGGVDRVMAEHNLGRLVQGDPAADIPLLEVYDFGVHLATTEGFMKSPEYLTLEPEIQTQFVLLRAAMQAAQQAQQLNAIQASMPIATATAAAQGAVATTQSVTSPAPAGAGSGPPGAPGSEAGNAPRSDTRAAPGAPPGAKVA